MSGEAQTDQVKTPPSSSSSVASVLSTSAWAFCGLLLLLAATAWLPAGEAGSVQKLLHLASPLLLAVTAIGVVLAAVVLVQAVTLLPSRARLLLGGLCVLLALYAVAALALAWSRNETFAALLSGAAFWQALPWWLQGPAIGCLLLLPLAVIAHVVLSVRRAGLGGLVRWRAQQPVALALVFAMVASTLPARATGSAAVGAASTATSSGAASPMSSAPSTGVANEPARPVAAPRVTLEQWRANTFKNQDAQQIWQRYAKAAAEELRRPGADPSDVESKAAALDHDRHKIFAFLRDGIIAEPYSGVLRGARGALVAEAANALDRALLGQALLKASGIETRLVSGRLPEPLAKGLLARYLATPPVSAALASAAADNDGSALDGAAEDFASKVGIGADQIAELLRQVHAGDQAFWADVSTRRTAQYDDLVGRLRQARVRSASMTSTLLQRFQEHWWLQVGEPSGEWTEFDPATADAQPGTTYGTAPVIRPKAPPELLHRFELSLVYRTTAGGRPRPQEILKGSVPAADAIFEPIQFFIQADTPTADPKAVLQMSVAQKIDVLKQMKRFQGLLRIGSKVTASRVFDLEGHTFDAPGANPMASPGGLMGGMLGFGSEDGGGAFLDLQVVLRLTGPGRPPITQTRTICRAADAARASFAPPMLDWSILVQPQWLSASFVSAQLIRFVLALGEQAAARKNGPNAPAAESTGIPQQLLQLAMLRQRATADLVGRQPGLHVLVDEPMVTIAAHQLMALKPQEGRVVGSRAIDIVTNRVRFVGHDEAVQGAAFDAAVRQGVADCALEQAFVEHDFPEQAAESGDAIFKRVAAEGRVPVVVNANDATKLAGTGMPASDLEWIRASEVPGTTLVVAATSTGSAAWWSVGPDGAAVLRVSGGGGQELTEHEVDVMYVILKGVFAGWCVYDVTKSIKHGPSAEMGWKLVFCTVAIGASAGFIISGWHAASWFFFGVEALEASLSPAFLE